MWARLHRTQQQNILRTRKESFQRNDRSLPWRTRAELYSKKCNETRNIYYTYIACACAHWRSYIRYTRRGFDINTTRGQSKLIYNLFFHCHSPTGALLAVLTADQLVPAYYQIENSAVCLFRLHIYPNFLHRSSKIFIGL